MSDIIKNHKNHLPHQARQDFLLSVHILAHEDYAKAKKKSNGLVRKLLKFLSIEVVM